MQTQTPSRAKLVVSILVALVVLSSALVSVVFFRSLQFRVAGEYQEDNLARLAEDYPANLKKTLADYVRRTEATKDEGVVFTETVAVKNLLLSWKVAPESKALHLRAVLLVSAIESLAQKGEAEAAALKLDELKAFLKDL